LKRFAASLSVVLHMSLEIENQKQEAENGARDAAIFRRLPAGFSGARANFGGGAGELAADPVGVVRSHPVCNYSIRSTEDTLTP